MAESFEFETIIEQAMWTTTYENAQGFQDRFLNMVKEEIEKTNFPNLDIILGEYKTGGIFFNKETTPMVRMKAKNSKFKKYEIFFRAQVFGNVVVYTRLECMEKGFLDTVTARNAAERYDTIRRKCKNFAQYEEFVALNNLGSIIFERSVERLDPTYKERKALGQK